MGRLIEVLVVIALQIVAIIYYSQVVKRKMVQSKSVTTMLNKIIEQTIRTFAPHLPGEQSVPDDDKAMEDFHITHRSIESCSSPLHIPVAIRSVELFKGLHPDRVVLVTRLEEELKRKKTKLGL